MRWPALGKLAGVRLTEFHERVTLRFGATYGASVLADHVPDRSRLVLAARDAPPLRVARFRAEGRIAYTALKELRARVEN